MGRGEGHTAPLGERNQRRRRERGTFGRIGSAAHLVEQDQRRIVRLVQDPAEHSDVRAEGRKAGGDRLSVADVGIEAPEHRQSAPRGERRNDPTLGQGSRETDRLEEHGLAAGVGTAHEQRAFVVSKLEVEGHNRFLAGEQQRMTPAYDDQRARSGAHRRAPLPPRRPHNARGQRDRPPPRTSRRRHEGQTAPAEADRSGHAAREVSPALPRLPPRGARCPSSIASDGSMKSVPALPDSSWMIPDGRARESRRTGMT